MRNNTLNTSELLEESPNLLATWSRCYMISYTETCRTQLKRAGHQNHHRRRLLPITMTSHPHPYTSTAKNLISPTHQTAHLRCSIIKEAPSRSTHPAFFNSAFIPNFPINTPLSRTSHRTDRSMTMSAIAACSTSTRAQSFYLHHNDRQEENPPPLSFPAPSWSSGSSCPGGIPESTTFHSFDTLHKNWI